MLRRPVRNSSAGALMIWLGLSEYSDLVGLAVIVIVVALVCWAFYRPLLKTLLKLFPE